MLLDRGTRQELSSAAATHQPLGPPCRSLLDTHACDNLCRCAHSLIHMQVHTAGQPPGTARCTAYLAEHDVAAVQPGGLHSAQEEPAGGQAGGQAGGGLGVGSDEQTRGGGG